METQTLGWWTRGTNPQPGFVIPDIQRVVPAPLITVYVKPLLKEGKEGDGSLVGFCTDINFGATSTAERIRHLSFFDAGRIIEQVQLPEDFTLSLTGFTLYNSSFLGRLAGTKDISPGGKELTKSIPLVAHIITPFSLRAMRPTIIETIILPRYDSDENAYTPGNIESITKAKTAIFYVYGDCVITGHTKPVSHRSAMISETITAQPSWVSVEQEELPETAHAEKPITDTA